MSSGSRSKWFVLVWIAFSLSCVFIFCEYVIYFPVISRCSWPQLTEKREPLRALFLSDPHLLGAIRGHWFDKLRRGIVEIILNSCITLWFGNCNTTYRKSVQRLAWTAELSLPSITDSYTARCIRKATSIVHDPFYKHKTEWQMERAFQTALWLLDPEMVFILGDIFDEGKWSSTTDWEDDVRRFRLIFRHPDHIELMVLVGNHDVGFHREMTKYKLERFEKAFNVTSAQVLTRKGVNFLLVNSVALHGDHCPICQAVENKLRRFAQDFNCSIQGPRSDAVKQGCEVTRTPFASSSPVILQHYPLYRVSDAECTGEDAAEPHQRYQLFEERYDVLSQEASKKLLWWFQPRLILSGHTHSSCEVLHENRFPEISVPSFSWRNRNNPSFVLGSFSSSDFALSKCFLPEESSVNAVYCSSALVILLLTLWYLQVFQTAPQRTSGFPAKQKCV